jgi:hypothetical protein
MICNGNMIVYYLKRRPVCGLAGNHITRVRQEDEILESLWQAATYWGIMLP